MPFRASPRWGLIRFRRHRLERQVRCAGARFDRRGEETTVRKQPASRTVKDEASLSRLAAIVDNSPDAILGVDLGGTVTDWNRGAERLYGYAADEMIGGSISALVPREAANELDNILETVRRGDVIGPYDT